MADEAASRAAESPASPKKQSAKAAAVEKLATAFAKDPGAAAADYGMLLCQVGRAALAATELEPLHANGSLSPRAKLALALAYFETFRLEEAETLLTALKGSLAEDPLTLRLLGEIALERHDSQAALELLTRAGELDPKDSRTQEALALLGVDEPGTAPERALARPARLRLQRTLLAGLVTLALLLGVVGVYAWRVRVDEQVQEWVTEAKAEKQKEDFTSLVSAQALYEKAAALRPSDKRVLGGLAEAFAFLYIEHGIGGALSDLELAAKRAASAGVNSGERFLAEGVAMTGLGHAAEAEAMLEATIAKGGIDAHVFFALGCAQKTLGKGPAAKESLRRAYELDPYQPAIACELGDLYAAGEDLKNAEFYYRKAAEASPLHLRAASRLLWVRLVGGEEPGALKPRIEELAPLALGASPAHAAAYRGLLGQASFELGDKIKGLELARAAQAQRPDDPVLLWELAELELRAGQEGGTDHLKQLEQRLGKNPQLTMDAARALLRFHKTDAAIAYVQANKDFAAQAPGLAFIARLQLAGNDAKAKDTLDRAAQIDAKNADVLFAQARFIQGQKQSAKALDLYSQALAARSAFPEVYEQVGNIYVDNKDYDSARKNFAIAENLFRQASAPVWALNALYEDIARSYDRQGGSDAKALAVKWRARIRK